ncbi:MAG: sugar phosphate isomerase/epimerase family protein [Candidatus Hydrogenedentota bacterium]
MDRRTFLKTTAITAGAAAFAANMPQAHAGEFTGKIKKAVKYNMVRAGKTPKEKLQILKDIGFDGVEPSFRDKVDPEELKAASDEVGLPIHGCVLGSVDGIPAAVDRAKLYGASSVLLVAGRVDENTPYEKNYIETQATIRDAIPYAKEQDILLLVENVWNNFLLTPLEMRRYLDELESDQVGCYLDLGNMVRFGWPEHWIPVLDGRVKKLDIKEYSREKQKNEGLWNGFKVDIGEGSVDWAACRRELKKIGYTGWATAEVGGGDEKHLADVAARMDRVLDLA